MQTINQVQSMEELMALYTAPSNPQKGELVEGTVLFVNKSGAYVDFGGKTEALVPAAELADVELTKGQTALFCVVRPAEDEQPATFSVKRAMAATELRAAKTDKTTVDAEVLEVRRNSSKGIAGLRARVLGQVGFIPYSMLGIKGKAAENVKGSLPVKVVEDGLNGSKLILSHALVLAEKAQAEQARQVEALNSLQADQVVPGKVVRLMQYGAFVDIGNGVRGLLHNSELSNAYKGDVRRDGTRGEPRKALAVNDELLVKVLGTDAEAGRVRLSLKGVQQPRRSNTETAA